MPTVTLLTPSIITKESLVILDNQLVAAKKVRRDFDDKFAGKGSLTSFKIGDTLNVRKPNRFKVRTNSTLSAQDVVEESVAVKVDKIAGVDFTFSMKDLTLTIEQFSERYLQPAMATIANKIDFDVLTLYQDVYNMVGAARTTPATFLALGGVGRRLNEEAAPKDSNRTLIVDPAAELVLSDAFKLFFNPTGAIGKQYEEAMLGRVAGLNVHMDQNVNLHTTGTVSNTTPAVDTNVTDGDATLHLDGLNGATVTANKGDVFSIAGVYAVNPQSRQSTGVLKQFVVTTTTTASGSEFATLPISPAIYGPGHVKQNVSVLPVDGDLVTFFDPSAATSTINLGFHKDAFALVTVPLEMPQGVHFAARESYEGISMRIVRAYSISDDTMPCRIDVLYGTKTIYPELACRLAG